MLEVRDFASHSLSDIVREEALAAGLTTGRDDLILTGNRLRREGGAGVLAERIAPRLGGRDVVDSIRNPAEVEMLRRLVQGFILVGVSASPAARYARAIARGRAGDALGGLDTFLKKEAEENTADPDSQQLDATFRLADRILRNDGGIGELESAVENLLAELAKR
jgi:dephospho-CoA kinase